MSSFRFYLAFLLLIIYSSQLTPSESRLNKFIRNYDNVIYDRTSLNKRHQRAQRSLDKQIYLNFKGYGRDFKLKLRPSKLTLFEVDTLELNNDTKSIDLNQHMYEGHLLDEPFDSEVSGIVLEGLFYGTITSKKQGRYFIESLRRYQENSTSPLTNNLIIYHENDVNLNNGTSHDHSSVHCGSSNKHVNKWLSDEQKKYSEAREFDPFGYMELVDDEKRKYTEELNRVKLKRSVSDKRDVDMDFNDTATRIPFPEMRTVCNLYLKVDPILYNEIFKNEGNRNPETTITYLLFFMNKHVEFLNSVFNSIKFYDAAKEKYFIGLKFMIHRTKIMTEDQCRQNGTESKLNEDEMRLCEPYLDVSTFLNYASLDNYADYCLAYTFTARDFADGTLGLAWVAKLAGSAGGVCEKRQIIQGVAKSLNTGILTVVNYQSRVPELVSQLTFAHEVAHNFGAEHDPTGDDCSPGKNAGGNYIMYRSATTGREKNNKNFSDCSRNQMGPLLHALVKNVPKFCFTKFNGSLCGNGIVEEGEECDCGYGGECKDKCCFDASEKDSTKRCKLRPGASCSPTQGHCCSKSCAFEPTDVICMQSNECSFDVKCSGSSASCPTANKEFFKPNLTSCNSGTQVCLNGLCSGSICEKYNMSQCFLEGDLKDKNQDKSILCHLACVGEKTNQVCMDSFEIPDLKTQNGIEKGLILKPGSPCMGTLGYCDIFSKCRSVDAEGPLLRLKKLLLNPNTLTAVQIWIRDYWYAFVVFVVGLLVFTSIFIKVCSVHTPSSNPNLSKALKVGETVDTLRRHLKRNHLHPNHHNHHENHHQRPGSSKQTKNHNHNHRRKISKDKPTLSTFEMQNLNVVNN